jgi:hypothetical protein
LQGPTPRLLNQLCHLGEGTLILRQQGLSLAKVTPFGLCVADERGGWNVLRDAVSGLESDLGKPHHVYLLADPDDQRPVFATSGPRGGIDLSIRLENQSWESKVIRGLIDGFGGIAVDARENERLGAGAWLDDWECTSPPGMGIRWEIVTALDACRWLEVEVDTGTHRGMVAFTPSFLDSEGAVIRIADATRKHVVFVDAGAQEFSCVALAPGHLRIRMERSEEPVSLAMSAA